MRLNSTAGNVNHSVFSTTTDLSADCSLREFSNCNPMKTPIRPATTTCSVKEPHTISYKTAEAKDPSTHENRKGIHQFAAKIAQKVFKADSISFGLFSNYAMPIAYGRTIETNKMC
jgi:hypothetical protein